LVGEGVIPSLRLGRRIVVPVRDLAAVQLDPTYLQTTHHGRRLLNQAIFKQLYIGDNGITADELHPPFDALVTSNRARPLSTLPPQGHQQSTNAERENAASEPAAREPHQETEADLLATACLDRGSSKPAMVETMGLEPTTPCLQTRTA
jgi:hypothetical protein